MSSLLSNIMLNELDKELECRELNFVRYADDCLIMVKSEKAANRVESITTFITKKLGFKVNAEKSKIAIPNQIKYLSFGFYKKNNQNIWRPKPHIKTTEKFTYKLNQVFLRKRGISLDQRLEELKYMIYGCVNYFRIADMKGFLEKLDMRIRIKFRVIIWKQWKKVRKRYTSLRKLGIDYYDAFMTANYRRGLYFIGNAWVVKKTISKESLNKSGLVNCLDHYIKVHIITN